MGQEMKISSAAIRRLRSERGWPQEQLAAASGLSLRTIQRVEADGSASMASATSLVATFGVQLSYLSDGIGNGKPARNHRPRHIGTLIAGMAVLMCALIGESGRLPGTPMSGVFAVLNSMLGVLGLLLVAPAAIRLVAGHQYAALALAILGTPLVVLSSGGLLVALTTGRSPMWQLGAFGIGGAALMAIALRQLAYHPQRPAVA